MKSEKLPPPLKVGDPWPTKDAIVIDDNRNHIAFVMDFVVILTSKPEEGK
jgi:hypothetical protein